MQRTDMRNGQWGNAEACHCRPNHITRADKIKAGIWHSWPVTPNWEKQLHQPAPALGRKS